MAVMSFFACVSPQTKFLLFFVVPVPAWALVSGFFLWDGYTTLTDAVCLHPTLSLSLTKVYLTHPISLLFLPPFVGNSEHQNKRSRTRRRNVSRRCLLPPQETLHILSNMRTLSV